jgi:hypothetical protein
MAWKKGESGNPSGRKVGTVTKAGKLRKSIEADLPEILSALTTAAKSG